MRMQLARGLCDALAVAMATGELGVAWQRPEMLQEGDPRDNVAEQESLLAQEAAQVEQVVKVLRREIGRSASVRDGFLAAFQASRDHVDTHLALMRLAELLFKGTEDTKAASDRAAVAASDEHTGVMRIRLLIKNAPQQEKRPAHPLKVVLPKAPKPKKPKAPEPGQALGMSASDLSACRTCIHKLMANKHCEPFTRPVDPVRDEAPDYFDVIKEPMDLSSVSNKLQSGQYKDRFQFKEDVELIFRNAKTYTPDPKAWIYYEASRSESAFRQLWNRITKTLEQAAARAEKAQVEDTPEEPVAPPADEVEAPPVSAPSTESRTSASPAPKKITIKLNRKGEKREAGEAPARPVLKIKRARTSEASSPSGDAVEAPSDTPKVPHADPGHLSEDPVLPGEADMPLQPKKARSVLQTVSKTKEAVIFLQPIDPVRDQAPTYYEEIKHPMDLSTIGAKLKQGQYKTMGEFASDMRLMFANCRQFNPPGTVPALMEQAVSRVWRREWSRAMVRKLEYSHKRSLQSMMGRLKQLPSGALFLYAVDPVALGIPTYFDVIPKENARDLTLISQKLRADQYDSIDALDADIRLMLHNCYTFNAGDERICDIARAFEKAYQQEIHALRQAMEA